MAGMDILESAGRSLTGAVEKAYLEFKDERIEPGQVTVTQVKKRSVSGISGFDDVIAMMKDVEHTASAVTDLTETVRNMKSNALEGISKNGKKRYAVKFNPKEINFQAKGGYGDLVKKMNFAASGKVCAKFAEMKTQIVMTVPLIFDDMERTDAFMMEKFTDPLALARLGVTSVVNEKGIEKESYSVRPQVEGLLGALHNEKTRRIAFCWGKMRYDGILSSVDAEYTMFNMIGNPIRAVVNLSITLIDEKVKDNDMGAWKESYQRAFGLKDYTSGTTTSVVGNLMNINL